MEILVIGSGGREHALAARLALSPRAERVWVAPGNGGTAGPAPLANLPLAAGDLQPPFERLISFARQQPIGLTVVGPEAPLAAGIVDAFGAAGLSCFGPTQAAARLESSKAFAKDFMARHGIPTAGYGAFSDYPTALAYLRAQGAPQVIKAAGLAGGKGVFVPQTLAEAETALAQVMLQRTLGDAGDQVVIEERLAGREVSLMAFSDGSAILPMPPARDHKAAYDGDRGPNTGGMGAVAPVAVPDGLAELALQRAVDGLREEGCAYTGVLYAGLMLSMDGPRVLEYNCRFGDPETQAVLPLLEGDLLDLLETALAGRLAGLAPRWSSGAAAAVVAAAGGYPGAYALGHDITGVEEAAGLEGVSVFHAGTRRTPAGALVTAGGRVLSVAGTGQDLAQALGRAYAGLARIRFAGMHCRTDIGAPAPAAAWPAEDWRRPGSGGPGGKAEHG